MYASLRPFAPPPSVWPHLFCGAGHEKKRGEQLKWPLIFSCIQAPTCCLSDNSYYILSPYVGKLCKIDEQTVGHQLTSNTVSWRPPRLFGSHQSSYWLFYLSVLRRPKFNSFQLLPVYIWQRFPSDLLLLIVTSANCLGHPRRQWRIDSVASSYYDSGIFMETSKLARARYGKGASHIQGFLS